MLPFQSHPRYRKSPKADQAPHESSGTAQAAQAVLPARNFPGNSGGSRRFVASDNPAGSNAELAASESSVVQASLHDHDRALLDTADGSPRS